SACTATSCAGATSRSPPASAWAGSSACSRWPPCCSIAGTSSDPVSGFTTPEPRRYGLAQGAFMAKNLGGAIIELLDSDRVELRAAAATVLAAVGKGDKSVEAALTGRLGDRDAIVRRIALEALADMGTSGVAARLIPRLRG